MSHPKQIPEFALKDVEIKSFVPAREINNPCFSDESVSVSETEYSLKVPGVGRFYAVEGKRAEYYPDKGADPQWVQFYLNNHILVALLHQRSIISFHASSFVYMGIGVMILGETGAGKSSLTLLFALGSGGFLTDDLTPVTLEGLEPRIMPLNRKVKIRRDTAVKLEIDPALLSEAENGTGKKYLSMEPVRKEPVPLRIIVKIETGPGNELLIASPSPAESFSLLRSEVCSWQMLAGMPDTEAAYLRQIVAIIENTLFIRVIRPVEYGLHDLYRAIESAIQKTAGF